METSRLPAGSQFYKRGLQMNKHWTLADDRRR